MAMAWLEVSLTTPGVSQVDFHFPSFNVFSQDILANEELNIGDLSMLNASLVFDIIKVCPRQLRRSRHVTF